MTASSSTEALAARPSHNRRSVQAGEGAVAFQRGVAFTRGNRTPADGFAVQVGQHAHRHIPADEVGLAILGPLSELDPVAYLRFASVYKHYDSVEDFEAEIDQLRRVALVTN